MSAGPKEDSAVVAGFRVGQGQWEESPGLGVQGVLGCQEAVLGGMSGGISASALLVS